MEMGEPEPIESFLPDPRDLPPMEPMPVMDEPKFTTMPVGEPVPFEDKNVFELRQETESMVNPYNQLPTSIRMPPAPEPTPRAVGPLTTRMSIEDMLEDRLTNLPVPVGEPVPFEGRRSFLTGLKIPERKSPLEDMIASGSLPKAVGPNPDYIPPAPIDLQAMFEEGKAIPKNMYPDFVPDRTTDRFNQIQAEKKANQVLQTKRSNAGTEETLGDGRIRITDRDGNVTFKEKPALAPAPVYTPPPQMSRRPMIPNFGNINLR
jgi:hypothetical protein